MLVLTDSWARDSDHWVIVGARAKPELSFSPKESSKHMVRLSTSSIRPDP